MAISRIIRSVASPPFLQDQKPGSNTQFAGRAEFVFLLDSGSRLGACGIPGKQEFSFSGRRCALMGPINKSQFP